MPRGPRDAQGVRGMTVGDFRFGVIDFICAVAAWAYESVRSWARRDGGPT